MIKRAALIYFTDEVSDEEARIALEKIANVLETPRDYDWETGKYKDSSVGDYVQDYDDDIGGPVWYIP